MIEGKDLLTRVGRLLEDCVGFKDGDAGDTGKKALDYYFMRPRGDEQAGRSQMISGDLSAMVDAVMSQMCDSFSGERVVEFEPETEGDAPQAAVETDAAARIVNHENRGFLIFQSAAKSALLHRLCATKVWPETEEKARERKFANVAPEAYAELTKAKPGLTIESVDFNDGTLRYVEKRKRKRIKLRGVAPENFLYTKNWEGETIDGIPCAAERHRDMRSAMRGAPWNFPADVVDRLHPNINTDGTSMARNPGSAAQVAANGDDPSTDIIEWFEAYAMIDVDGSGVAQLRQVCFVYQQEVLEHASADFRPYAVGKVIINPHRLPGVSLYDKLKQTQDRGTALIRAAHDNMNAANKSRTVHLTGAVANDDLEDGRINGNIGVDPAYCQDVRQAVAALMVPDMSTGILAHIEANKRDRGELGGASLDMATGQAQLTDRAGSQGIDRVYSVMEQLASTMTRTMAETLVRETYLLVHRTMRANLTDAFVFRRRGVWTTTNPKDWQEREVVTVKVGMSPGERRRREATLWASLDMHLKLAAANMDGILTSMPVFYRTYIDWLRASNVPTPELYMLDPESPGSKKAQAEREAAQQKAQASQGRLMNMALGLEQMRVALTKYNGDADRGVDLFKAILEAQTTEAGIVGEAATKFELQAREAAGVEDQNESDLDALDSIQRAAASVQQLLGKPNGAPADELAAENTEG